MAKKKKSTEPPRKTGIPEPDKSLVARSIDWANKYVPGNPANNMARFIANANYKNQKSEASIKKDACAKHKKILKGVTGDWYDKPGSADVLGMDVPSTEVKEHARIDPKTGNLLRVKKHHRLTKKFPGTCKKDE